MLIASMDTNPNVFVFQFQLYERSIHIRSENWLMAIEHTRTTSGWGRSESRAGAYGGCMDIAILTFRAPYRTPTTTVGYEILFHFHPHHPQSLSHSGSSSSWPAKRQITRFDSISGRVWRSCLDHLRSDQLMIKLLPAINDRTRHTCYGGDQSLNLLTLD